LRARANVVPTV